LLLTAAEHKTEYKMYTKQNERKRDDIKMHFGKSIKKWSKWASARAMKHMDGCCKNNTFFSIHTFC
jgi:hypothetical protein